MAESKETNINVVVRVRPRNQKEIRENSPVVITTSGVKGKELHVKANPSDPQSKTYSFDKVFGPDADQEMVYDEVVAPILEEVLMGYNCTIFAYGQTGTGKTYTMEGDLDTCQGKHAGIIPRTLYRLFDKLEKEDSEYSVRVSFLEIYNEELRDLLSNDEPGAPKLKIFEDMNRRGSNEVQGMEKILVNSAQDVISILQKGSHKRQTAATKMNEASSRSHCIFTITVHIKETTADGEDLLKVGKLNLVDLAGSENVGRSGAEKGRAKEAGMINQSLLTLGRVINALVEKGLHIPYRESKLTRLLQDSLGGKTKTCIVAAVSPAKINIEESLSTLDYAHRAKNIRNKPEVNQRMTKKALIREYETQIERLKLDLQATRDKNGVYLAAETYKDLVETGQSRKDRIDEVEKTIQAKEEAILKIEKDFKEQMAVLDTTKKQLSGTQAELSVQTQNLEAALGNVSILKQNLTEHKILIDAHSTTEASLHSLHSGLVGFTERAVSDNYGLHAKLERKSAVEISNMRVFNDFQNGILREMSTLESGLGMYKTVSEQFTTQILEKLREFHQLQVQNCQTTRTTAADALHSISDALVDLKRVQAEANAGYADDMVSVLGRVESMVARLEEEQETKQMEVVQSLESVAASLTKHSEMTREWHKGMGNSFSELMNAVKANTSTHTASYESMYKTYIESMQNEIQSLRSLNEALEQRAACQKTVQNDAQAKLLSAISQLVGTYTAETESRNDELVKSVVDGMNEAIEQNEDVSANVEKIRQVDMASRESAEMAIENQSAAVAACIRDGFEVSESQFGIIESAISDSKDTFNKGVLLIKEATLEGMAGVREGHNAAIREAKQFVEKQYSQLDSIAEETAKAFDRIDNSVAAVNECLGVEVATFTNMIESYDGTKQTYFMDAEYTVSQARNEIQCKRLTLDEPTGKTPRKRKLQVPMDWVKTRDHKDLLNEFRELGQVPTVAFEPVTSPVQAFKKHFIKDSPTTCSGEENDDFECERGEDVEVGAVDQQQSENEPPIVAAAAEKVSAAETCIPPATRTMGKIRGNSSGGSSSAAGNGSAGEKSVASKLPTMKTRSGSNRSDSPVVREPFRR